MRGLRGAVVSGAVIAALLLLTLGGCGSSDGGSTASTAGAKPYRGGEKSIEEFGGEAQGSARTVLLNTFRGYFRALVRREFAAACVDLSETVQRSVEQLAGKGAKSRTCASLLPGILVPGYATVAREQASARVTKVRVKGDQAFVVFHAPGAKLYQLALVREGGRWRATTIASSVLVPSPASLGLQASGQR